MIHASKHFPLPRILTLGFIIIISVGTLLLSLPVATNSGHSTGYLNALFTATSATCITGMTVVNTALHWSIFGKIVILILVEIGGLGFMTFAVLLFSFFKRKVDLTTSLLAQESLSIQSTDKVYRIVQLVVCFSLLIQGLGTALLFIDFGPKYGFIKGLAYSLFHSVNAFCNAGFDLYANSLTRFAGDSYLLLVLSILIIAGSLGFLVWEDLLLFHQTHRLSLHTKLALVTYLGLIGISFIVYLITEQNFKTQTQLTDFQRLIDTFFISVSPRTAGFSIFNYNSFSDAGILFTIILMFIGGTPGSTAGGIKTTTVGILLIKVWSILRGKRDATFMGRRFSDDNVNRSLTLGFLVAVTLGIAALILLTTEPIPKYMGFEYIIFDVVSAFGTTGLTLGLTANLTVIGKLIFCILMFMGRVGIFTVMYSVLTTHNPDDEFRYPEENIMIG